MHLKKQVNDKIFEDEDVMSSSDDPDFSDKEIDKYDYSNDDDLFKEDLGDGFSGDMSGGFSPMEKHSDLLKSLTDFEPFMKVIVSEWLGMIWSEDQGKYIQDKAVPPTMNLYGARWCVNQLRIYTRDNNIITNLDKETYKDIMNDITETVFLNVGCRAEEFGIKNDGDILKVCNQLCHAAALVLVGTGGTNNYKDLLTKSVSRNENVSYMEQSGNRYQAPPKKKGLINGVTSFFTGK